MEVSLLMKEREDVGLKYLENPKGKDNLFFLITHYSLLLSHYLWLLSHYFLLLNSYYGLLHVSFDYFWLMSLMYVNKCKVK